MEKQHSGINYISQIFTPVESLGMEIQTIQSAVAGIRRINEFLSMEEFPEREELPEVEELSGTEELPERDELSGTEELPEVEELSKKEQIPEGNRFPEKRKENGEVRIQGIAASNIPDGDKRRIFGYVEQSFHMVPGTVKDQITLFDSSITDQEVKEVASLTGLQETIEVLPDGYDTICTPELFSQGQWQLLSIARAAVASPRLLLLDEITANLDAETEKEVLQALKRVSGERTVISVSHRTSAEMGRVIPIG